MPTLPGPVRATLGLVVVTVENARSLPVKAVEIPVAAVSSVLQLSLRAQQRYAELTSRGDEVLSRLRGTPEEAPAWATFDEPPNGRTPSTSASASASAESAPVSALRTPPTTATVEESTGSRARAASARSRPAQAKAGPVKRARKRTAASVTSTETGTTTAPREPTEPALDLVEGAPDPAEHLDLPEG